MTYQYCTLPRSNIRLCRLFSGRPGEPLRGEIFEVAFPPNDAGGNLHPYEALSYVWGREASPEPILVAKAGAVGHLQEAAPMSLGANLHSALSHLRLEHSDRVIWCDRICIDQANLAERAREVARMADIYRRARRVIVWLGPEAEDSGLALNALRYAGSQVRINPKTRTWRAAPDGDPRFSWEAQHAGSPFSQAEMCAIKKLVARRWFKRLWTRQEITLASTAVIRAGHDEVAWGAFVSAAVFLDSLVRLRGHSDAVLARDLFNIYELGCLKEYRGPVEVLHACRACECTEQIDRVYGVLGLLAIHRPLAIRPDYTKPAKKAYQDLVLEAYNRDKTLDMLALCEAAETPSWVPDLDKLRLNTGLHIRVVPYCRASGEGAASLSLSRGDNTIEVYGVRCGVVDRAIAQPLLSKKKSPDKILEDIVDILREQLGHHVSLWNRSRLESTAKGLLGTLWHERTGRQNHSCLAFAMTELQNWASNKSIQGDPPHAMSSGNWLDQGPSRVLFNHITRVLFHGDSCRLTEDGDIGLGFSGIKEGDILFAILGCRRLLALRQEPDMEGGKYRVIGKFDHPRYNDGEAFLGELGPGWQISYRHGLSASNRPLFEHEDKISQWQDPRLQSVPLPEGWREDQDEDGIPYWCRTDGAGGRSVFDPRLSPHELRNRGVKLENLVIV